MNTPQPSYQVQARVAASTGCCKHGVTRTKGGQLVEAGFWCEDRQHPLYIEIKIMKERHPLCEITVVWNKAAIAEHNRR